MGHQELLLTLAAIAMFGVVLLNMNRKMIEQNEDMIQREFEYYAISLAQSFIEEAKTKVFDENVITASAASPADFTSYGALGSEGGEVYPNFDDYDDFDGYSAPDTAGRDTFFVAISVGYVNEGAPETIISAESYYKRMTVSVSNRYLDAPVNLSYVFGFMEN